MKLGLWGWSALHLAVLSRFSIAKNRSINQVSYLLDHKRFQVSRGIGEVKVQANSQYRFVLFNAHLKSKRPVGGGADATAVGCKAFECQR